jgi:hypothetical protein
MQALARKPERIAHRRSEQEAGESVHARGRARDVPALSREMLDGRPRAQRHRGMTALALVSK